MLKNEELQYLIKTNVQNSTFESHTSITTIWNNENAFVSLAYYKAVPHYQHQHVNLSISNV